MAAGRIIIPQYMPAEDANGTRIAGARLYFYDYDGEATTTPKLVYTTSDLDVEHANPVVADSSGIFPAIWADTDEEFTVVVTDGSGAPLRTYDGVSGSIDATLASVALSQGYAEQAADAAASALGAPGTQATSSSNLAIGTGSKVFELNELGKALSPGQRIVAASEADSANQMSGRIEEFNDPFLTVDVVYTGGAGAFDDWIISLTGDGAVSSVAGLTGDVDDTTLKAALDLENVDNTPVLGVHSLWVPAAAMVGRTTNGAAVGLTEIGANKVMFRTADFDASTIEYVQFSLRMPKSWDEGTVTAIFEWSHAATTVNFKVSWGIQAVALSDDDAGDAAFGVAQYANDTGGTTNDLYASPATPAVTVGGAPAAEDLVVFQIFRKADDAVNDTLAVDARLHGVTLNLTTNAGTDA